MTRTQKWIACLLSLTLLLTAAGCGQTLPEETVGDTTGETTGQTSGQVAFVTPEENTVTEYDALRSDYQLSIDAGDALHDISELLYGIFFEDINFAADGGLYAEMVVNRSFEFTEIAKGDQLYGWSTVGTVTAEVAVGDAEGGLNENNTNYLVLTNTSGEAAGVANCGFLDGMNVEAGKSYDFSVYAKAIDGYDGTLTVKLMQGSTLLGTATVSGLTDQWQKFSVEIPVTESADTSVRLQVLIDDGSVALDMISLFPQDTHNGLRADLVDMLAALEPSFLRFPGGCITEGYDYETMYNWKDSIGVDANGNPLLFNGTYGDVAARSQGINIWTDIALTEDPWPSYMTYGLGFYEYFQLAEDIGAVGVPVVNCGMYCQARAGKTVSVNSDEFQQFIQDALDLVEFCRGGADTKWGAVRIAMGHEEPFELRYICIGNENYGSDYYRRYAKFVEAFAQAAEENPELYGDIQLIYSSGTDDATSSTMNYASYVYAEEWLEDNDGAAISDFAAATDHHYYNTPEWFLLNADYYDPENYSRESLTDTDHGGVIPVFLGEYAAQSNTLYAALAEAAYMTGLERNSDVVIMAAYAPLFGNLTAYHWAPDLIWFNNHTVTGSINYYMQKLFSTNVGTAVLASSLSGQEAQTVVPVGKVGVGTWNTTASFDNILVVSNATGEVLGEQTFDTDTFGAWDDVADGDFYVEDGKLIQANGTTTRTTTGTVAYYGDTSWTDYTYTVEATKISGSEGFLIPFVVEDADDHYFWNIGGWNNTVSCLQQVSGGAKGDQVEGTVRDCKIVTGQTYTLKVVVSGTNVKCYIDDELYIDYDFNQSQPDEAYQVVSVDDNGDIIIKLVNITGEDRVFAIDIANVGAVSDQATVCQVKGDSLNNDNILGAVEDCIMETFTVSGISSQFNYTVPQYSATVIRISQE